MSRVGVNEISPVVSGSTTQITGALKVSGTTYSPTLTGGVISGSTINVTNLLITTSASFVDVAIWPHDLRPNTISITDLSSSVVTQITSSTTASYYISGSLFSTSQAVYIISSSAGVTSSIETQTYLNNQVFSVVLSASAPAATGTIKLAVYKSPTTGDGSVTLNLTGS